MSVVQFFPGTSEERQHPREQLVRTGAEYMAIDVYAAFVLTIFVFLTTVISPFFRDRSEWVKAKGR